MLRFPFLFPILNECTTFCFCALCSQEKCFWTSKLSWRRCTRSTARTTTMPSLCWRATRRTKTSSATCWSVWRDCGESLRGGKSVKNSHFYFQISALSSVFDFKRIVCTRVTANVHVCVCASMKTCQ